MVHSDPEPQGVWRLLNRRGQLEAGGVFDGSRVPLRSDLPTHVELEGRGECWVHFLDQERLSPEARRRVVAWLACERRMPLELAGEVLDGVGVPIRCELLCVIDPRVAAVLLYGDDGLEPGAAGAAMWTLGHLTPLERWRAAHHLSEALAYLQFGQERLNRTLKGAPGIVSDGPTNHPDAGGNGHDSKTRAVAADCAGDQH